MAFLGKQIKADGLPGVDSVVNPYGDRYQRKLNVSFPDCSHNINVRLKSEPGRAKILKMFDVKKCCSIEVPCVDVSDAYQPVLIVDLRSCKIVKRPK